MLTRRFTLGAAVVGVLGVIGAALVFASASGTPLTDNVEQVAALQETRSGPDDEPSEHDAPPASRPDLQPESAMMVEGTVVGKDILSVKNRPEIRYSDNAAERHDQRAVAEFDRYRAEIDVKVDDWVVGDGPSRIRVVRGVAFEGLNFTASASTDWVDRKYYDALEVGGRYRFTVNEDRFFKGNFYDLVSIEDEGYERID